MNELLKWGWRAIEKEIQISFISLMIGQQGKG